MRYLFASERRDYSDYASDHVFMGRPGHPAFPLWLASELFQRCRRAPGRDGSVCALRPVLRGRLSTLAYLHGHEIDQVIGSDIDEEALALATRNLSLLRLEGLDRRIEDLASDKRQKIAHESYERLERLRIGKRQIVLLKPPA